MQEFNVKATCPKCHEREIGSAWCPGRWHHEAHLKHEGEGIHRHCQTCHFEWIESVKALEDRGS